MTDYANEAHHIVAFFGFDATLNQVQTYYDYFLESFGRLGIKPRNAGVGKTKKLLTFAALSRKLERGQLSMSEGVSVYYLPPEVKTDIDGVDAIFSITLKSELYPKNPGECIVEVRNAILDLEPSFLQTIATFIATSFRPKYGFTFNKPFNEEPYFLTLGMQYGEDDELNQELVMNHAKNIRNGAFLTTRRLSGVFPLNYLTPLQLDQPMGKQQLRDWLTLDKTRGSLTPFVGEMMCWKPPEANIPKLLRELQDAGLILDWDAEEQEFRSETRQRHASGASIVKPSASADQVLSDVLGAMGYESADEFDVLKVEQSGITRKLTKTEKEKATKRRKGNA